MSISLGTHRVLALAWLPLVALGCSGSGGGDCQQACSFYHECAETEDCLDGCCQVSRHCTQDYTCQPGGKCVGERCVKLCLNDTDCPAATSCVYGFCEPYPQDVYDALHSAAPDEPAGAQHALQVGIGDVPLEFPVGVSMAGYGARIGPHTPYRKTLGGSDSMWDRPRVKAVVLDNGVKRIVLVRAATSWTVDHMVSHTAWRLYQATGQNYLNRLVFSACHTHSYPGRYSYWLPDKSMGVLGHGDYSREIFERHTAANAAAVEAALADMRPAKIGWTFLTQMDPEHKVHRDRRGEDQDPMDDSLLSLRIDEPDGTPRAFLFDFALHGTHSSDTTVTGDAPGAVEIIAQQRLQEVTGAPVTAIFLSGASGDVSPAGDETDLDDWRKIQEVGRQAWPILKTQFDALDGQTVSDVDLDIATLRAPVNRQVLGYAPGDFRDENGNDYLFGAFQCVGAGDEDPLTTWQDGELGCIFSTELLADGVPVPDFCKVHLTAVRIGNLGLVTLPGEPLGRWARDIAQAFLDEGLQVAAVLGYSQDHHFYLMHEDSWLQGGYEPSMDIWGWTEADYYQSLAKDMIQRLVREGGFLDEADMLPSWYEAPDDTVQPTATPATDAGRFVLDAPATVERVSLLRLQWIGGHPGVDLPRATLEREDAGTWSPVVNAAGVVYSDDGHSTMLHYLGDYDLDHTWQLSWEERRDFPLGRYRIRIDGHRYDGGGMQPYSSTSSPFEFVACSRLVIAGLSLDASAVHGAVLNPPGPTNDDGVSAFSGLEPVGYLQHTGSIAPQMPWPVDPDGSVQVTVSVQPPAGPAVLLDPTTATQSGDLDYTYVNSRAQDGVTTTAQRRLAATLFQASHALGAVSGTYTLTVDAQDAYGNTGRAEVQIQVP